MRKSRDGEANAAEYGHRQGGDGSEAPPRRYQLACTTCGYETLFRGDGLSVIDRSSEHEVEMAARGARDHVVEVTMLEERPEADATLADADGGLEPVERTEWIEVSRRESARVSSVRRRGDAD